MYSRAAKGTELELLQTPPLAAVDVVVVAVHVLERLLFGEDGIVLVIKLLFLLVV
jgi:hypothetical protein